MSRFYDRRWELLVNDKTLIPEMAGRQFKMVFTVIIDFGGYISYADIALYNMSTNTVEEALKRGATIGLRAGYIDAIDYIFKGSITNVLRERVGADLITRIIAKGGSQPETQQVNITLGENSTVIDVIKACASSIGYPLVIKDSDFSGLDVYARGYQLNGDPVKLLNKLAMAHDFKYVIENDKIVIVAEGSSREGSPYVVNQFNGMEGVPEITENGADVSLRLSPRIRIGSQVDIQSELVTFNFSNLYFTEIPESAGSGIYDVYRLDHSGDTWGDAWTTKVTGFGRGSA